MRIDIEEVVHVYPLHDERQHETDHNRCWCCPEYDIRAHVMLVLHTDRPYRQEWGERRVDESHRESVRNVP